MEITQIPKNYASLLGSLPFAFADSARGTFDVKIVDGTNRLLGVKRLTDVSQGSVDIAPYLRRNVLFDPQTGPTGFVATAGRAVTAGIEIGNTASEKRTFVPTAPSFSAPAVVTTLYGTRQIGRGECDELTLLSSVPSQIRVEVRKSGQSSFTDYLAPNAGFALFRFNTADFPNADMIHVHIGGYGPLSYYFTDFSDGRRMAWRSSAGSVEHYTFPVAKEAEEEVEKDEVLTGEGYRTVSARTRHLTTLLSAYEPRQVLRPLGEILSSPEVWSVEEGRYIPVRVVNAASGIRRHGTLCNLEVQIAHAPKFLLP